MSCSKLTKLVKAYTNGEIPLEVYREKRRQIVDSVVDGAQQKNKNDPLDAFIASPPGKARTHGLKPSSIYLTIAGAVVTIGIAVYLFLNNKHPGIDEQATGSDTQTGTFESKSQAQKLVDKFLRTNQWNEEVIDQFILDWQILSTAERQKAKNTVWFGHFKSIVQNKLDEEKNQPDKTNTLGVDLLTSLLVTIDPSHFIRQPFFTHESKTPPAKLATESTKPSQPPIAAKKRVNPLGHVVRKEPTQPDTRKEPAEARRKTTPRTPPHAPKAADNIQLNNMLGEFTKSFQNGNLDNLMRLFSPHATTNYHSSAAEIRNSYAELFKTTTERDLNFSHFSWKKLGTKIAGRGKYLAHLNPKGTNVDQVFAADVTISVDDSGQSPLILSLYLTNQQFSTNLRQAANAPSPKAPTPPPLKNKELKTLLTTFVTAYNHGNINDLMGLFSQEARTNDRSNINDIRSDYVQLFRTTRSREIILTNIVWDVDGARAVANGNFEARIQPSSGIQPNVYRGKIRIAVTKFKGGILITQLLHNTF